MDNVIFFDGICNVCDYTVEFVLEHDQNKVFKFSSLQSEFASNFLKEKNVEITMDTIILSYENELYFRSDAMILILKNLKGFPWFLGYCISFLPFFLRDSCYSVFSKYRYKVFGKKTICKVPNKKHLNLFLD